MDPNEALKKAREASNIIGSDVSQDVALAAAVDLMMYFDALDQWLSRGGFLPIDWGEAKQTARKFMGRRSVSPRGF